MKIFFVESETGISRGYVMDSLKQAIQEKMPDFQNDAVFSLAYEREDQFFLKSPEAILWGKVYFDSVQRDEFEVFDGELKKLSGIFRRKIIPYVFFGNDSGGLSHEFSQVAKDCFAYSFVQADGRRALTLRKISVTQEPKIVVPFELKGALSPKESEGQGRSFQLSREELSELIDLSLELRHLN